MNLITPANKITYTNTKLAAFAKKKNRCGNTISHQARNAKLADKKSPGMQESKTILKMCLKPNLSTDSTVYL
jgi:hypothetical protein